MLYMVNRSLAAGRQLHRFLNRVYIVLLMADGCERKSHHFCDRALKKTSAFERYEIKAAVIVNMQN